MQTAQPSLATIYRRIDDNGKIVFGDTPPKNKATATITIDDIEKTDAN